MSDGKTPQDENNAEDDSPETATAESTEQTAADTTPTEQTADEAEASSSPPDAGEPTPPDAADSDAATASKSWLWLALVALVVVIAGAAFWLWPREAPEVIEQRPATATVKPAEDLIPAATVADIDALREQINSLNSNIGALSSELEEANQTINSQARDFERLKNSVEDRVDLLDSLPGRVQNNEDALATLQGISAGSRNAWLLAEAEYYMQIANAQVQLANNPQLAATALALADQRIRELGDPAYTPVRRAMAEEIAALNAINSSDIEGITLTLGSLASMVPSLPLINEIDVPEAQRQRADLEGLSGWQRMKASVNNALSGLVRVRQSDERVKAMLSPEAEYFLRLNLQLQLQAARLSLLLSETAGYRQSLQDAAGWLREYFERDDPSVQNALQMIEDVAGTEIVAERPDISESLRLLRQQRTIEAMSE